MLIDCNVTMIVNTNYCGDTLLIFTAPFCPTPVTTASHLNTVLVIFLCICRHTYLNVGLYYILNCYWVLYKNDLFY